MKQNKEDADRSADADEDIVLEAQTLGRLESIRKESESCDSVLTRLLDDAVHNVRIGEILQDLLSRFEDTVSINVRLSPLYENPRRLDISVHTGEASFEENVSLYAGKEPRATIESKSGEQFCLPFDIIATCDGPKSETMGTTPVYATDNILGMEPVSLDEGLDQLRAKMGRPRHEVRELVRHH